MKKKKKEKESAGERKTHRRMRDTHAYTHFCTNFIRGRDM